MARCCKNTLVQILSKGFKNSTVLVLLGFSSMVFFLGCGSKTSAKPLKVELRIPPGEDSEVFWYGVTKKTLTLKSEQGRQEFSFNPGSTIPLEIPKNSTIEFSGKDSHDRELVLGSAKVPEAQEAEQSVLPIPLQRAATPGP